MIDRINHSDDLLASRIATRTPCIITAIPDDLTCLSDCIDLSYLEKQGGHAPVSVEPISGKGTFGTAATKTEMSLSNFLQKLRQKDKVYLTTQYSEGEHDDVLTEPLLSLRQNLSFPVVPNMAHELVTAKINLWLGASLDGTTSGLHHDFHDNIYILLSGQKRFRIFRPSWQACEKLKIHGRPHEIFESGLISYDGSLCSDGLHAITKAQIRVDVRERALSEARTSGSSTDMAEARYEEAVDQLLDAKLRFGEGTEDDDFGAEKEFENEDGGYEDNDGENEDLDESFQGIESLEEFQTNSSHIPAEAASSQARPMNASEPEDLDEPPSFSTLSSDEVTGMLAEDSLEGYEFVLNKGEMLYLPASFFHEVISMSGQQDFHMALNYWFYPPDSTTDLYQDREVMDELRARLIKSFPSVPDSEFATKKRKIQR